MPISFGSDAHVHDHLGMSWGESTSMLARLGVGRLVAFRGRELGWVEVG